MFSRRGLLQGLGAAGLSATLSPAWASTPGAPRLLLLILRGGMDGLAVVPPFGDSDYRRARGSAAAPVPGQGSSRSTPLDLDGFFGLHEGLADLKPWYDDGDLALVHATAMPYRERSHFDAQNVLESGGSAPFDLDTGWLNRAVGALGGSAVPMAMSRTVPLVLRGDTPVTSADPLRAWTPDDSLMSRVVDLYQTDPQLGPALEAGIRTQGMLEVYRDGERVEGRGRNNGLAEAATVIGSVLGAHDGPRVAVAEVGGWDTHTGQDATLARLLESLSGALVGVRAGLGPAWDHTVVLCVTEFGRTVAANGTGGTDHGTASVALAAGGAVRGGRVLGTWPGLAERFQRNGRDLSPTTDLRAVFKGVLLAHLGVPETALEDTVFKGTGRVAPMVELIG